MTICRLLVVVLAAVVMVPCRGSLSPSVYLQIFFLKSEYKNIYIVKTFIPEDIGCGGASLRGAAQRQRVAL